MNRTIAAFAIASLAAGCAAPPPPPPPPPDPTEKVQALLAARTPQERAPLLEALLATRPDPAAVAAALAAGRPYAKEVPTGWLERNIVAPDGRSRPYLLHVPESYDPARRYRMVIDMHGGVSLPQPLTHDDLLEMKFFWGAQAEERGWILAFPAGDRDAIWWNATGAGMVLGILRETKRQYNLDEDAVFATGFSDGGSGSWYLAATHPTPFAGFIPLNGHPSVATAGGLQLHLRGLCNRPMYAVNTDQDSLYPSASLKPVVEALRGLGAPLLWKEISGFGHDPAYLPGERPAILAWMDGVRRPADPPVVWWEGAEGAPGRVDWIRVTKVTGGSGQAPFPDANPELVDARVRLGVTLDPGFPGPGARVEGVQEGSTAAAMGIRAGDLLTGVDGAGVATAQELRAALRKKARGDAVTVSLRRGEETLEFPGTFPAEARERAFPRANPWGTLRAGAQGNRIEVATLGIGAFEVLLSPRLVDLARPVTVAVNGTVVFEGIVPPDLQFMLEQALEDEDRSLVYRARIAVTVP